MAKDELMLLKHLRKNSRERLLKISRMSNIDVAALIKLYEYIKERYITKNCSIIDFEKLSIKRFLVIIDFKHVDVSASRTIALNNRLIRFLKESLYVNNLMLLERGLMADAIFREFNQYKEFAQKIRGFEIRGMEIYTIEEQIVAENFMSYKG